MIYPCHVLVYVLNLDFTLEWPLSGRNGYVYINTVPMGATFTKLIPTAHLDIILCGGLCPWPTFYGRVTMVRKKLLCIYDMTYCCYIPQTCTNFSSWHDLLMSRGGLFPWPLSPWLRRKGYVYISVPIGATFTLLASCVHIAPCHVSSNSTQGFQRSWKSEKGTITILIALYPLVEIIFLAIPFAYDFASKINIKEKKLQPLNKLTK